MSLNNKFIQSRIKNKKSKLITINLKPSYYTLCPSPLEIKPEVIEGDTGEHTFKWSILEGPNGTFHPSSKKLNIVFNPLGDKAKRVLELKIDEGMPYEQIFTTKLYDENLNPVELKSESTFGHTKFKDITLAARNFNQASLEAIPLISPLRYKIIDDKIINIIEYPNISGWEIEKVEIYDESGLLAYTLLSPDTVVPLALPPLYTLTYGKIHRQGYVIPARVNNLSSSFDKKTVIIIDEQIRVINEVDLKRRERLLGDGYKLIVKKEKVQPVITSDIKGNSRLLDLTSSIEEMAQNSLKARSLSSSALRVKFLNPRTGVIG